MKESFEERFWSHVDRTGECWLWLLSKDRKGYGYCMYQGKVRKAHRVAWAIAHGELPPSELFACHRCDNPSCVRPSHIFLGTTAENMADMRQKGRSATGERQGSAKLKASDVGEIWALMSAGVSQADLARKFGVDPKTISHIKHGLTWWWLTGASADRVQRPRKRRAA